MHYEQLGTEYQDDQLAEAMYGREREYFHYDFDRRNFEQMLLNLPASQYGDGLAQRLADTKARMEEVDCIYSALKAQITDPAAHARAVERCRLKREAAKG